MEHMPPNTAIYINFTAENRAQTGGWNRKSFLDSSLSLNCPRLANQIIQPGNDVGSTRGHIQCHQRLGGMLRYYYRLAA